MQGTKTGSPFRPPGLFSRNCTHPGRKRNPRHPAPGTQIFLGSSAGTPDSSQPDSQSDVRTDVRHEEVPCQRCEYLCCRSSVSPMWTTDVCNAAAAVYRRRSSHEDARCMKRGWLGWRDEHRKGSLRVTKLYNKIVYTAERRKDERRTDQDRS